MRSSMMSRSGPRLSKLLVFSYVFDWVVVIVVGVIGTILNNMKPNMRPFSLGNQEISFPMTPDTISVTVLAIVSVPAPAAIILIVCLLLVPGSTVPKNTPKSLIWKRKLWEWFTGWLGLGVCLASTWFITNGLKNLIGKPRPDMITRCIPDLANFAKYSLTSFPNTPANSALVSAAICTQTDTSILNDGFRSFPSGHSSFSAAGLIYLSLFLASKFAITIPFLSPRAYSTSSAQYYSAFPSRLPRSTLTSKLSPSSMAANGGKTHIPATDMHLIPTNTDTAEIAARNQAAAPPVYLLLVAFVPTAVAIFIAATRYCDFRHHGFDIISGFVIGLLNAVFAFRLYHLPVSQGAGWSWGPRSRARALWAGVGRGSYVGVDEDDEEMEGMDADADVEMQDLEAGRMPIGEGRGQGDDNVRT